jgi:hypothetical protein
MKRTAAHLQRRLGHLHPMTQLAFDKIFTPSQRRCVVSLCSNARANYAP